MRIDTHAEKLAGAAPGIKLKRLDGLGHTLHYAQPEAVVESIEAVGPG